MTRMKNLRRNWLVISRLTWEIWRILTRALRTLKDFHFNWLLMSKVYIFWLKRNRGVIFQNTKEWCKMWRKTDLWLGKRHEEFGIWLDPFIQNRKCMSLNLRRCYVSWQWKTMQNLESNWLVISNVTWEIWQILTVWWQK